MSKTIHDIGWRHESSYAQLPGIMFQKVLPAKVRSPRAVILNLSLADQLGLDLQSLPEDAAAALFTGQTIPEGAEPTAQAYAGHQYGGFTMLGDGRAILLTEHRTPGGQLVDIQFKGSGPTPYSRRGDGRAALGPMLREYIISEAMFSLGIPTTRSLAVATTGELVYRERPLRGAILTRVAASHIRVGTFQFLAARRELDKLQLLADYSIQRHYPDLVDRPQKYLEFLRAVIDRQAALIAQWQNVGFVHGVMNTDNMAISGETIDYGPCAFMNSYDLKTVFSSIDEGGRYAFGNQPSIAQWNLARLAETLLAMIDPDLDTAVALATEALNRFPEIFEAYWLNGMRRKLGLSQDEAEDAELIRSLLTWMETHEVDFTNTFVDLSSPGGLHSEIYQDAEFQSWLARWRERLDRQSDSLPEVQQKMQQVNPYVIPRNHRVEEALAAADAGNLSVMNELIDVLSRPYVYDEKKAAYRQPPSTDQCGYRTFCGT